jgi:hypothetical protein
VCDEWSALSHGGECGGEVVGRPRSETRVDADRGVEVGIGRAHNRGHRSSCRHPGHVHAAFCDVILAHYLVRYACDDGWFAPATLLVGDLEPVPALLHVGVARLRRIGHEEGVLLGELVHACARSEVIRALGATVQHDDQGNGLPGVAARDVKFVGAGPGAVGVRTLDEASSLGDATGCEFSGLRTRRALHAAGEQGRPRSRPRSHARAAYDCTPPVLGSFSYETRDYLYRLVHVAGILLCRRGERDPEGALDSGGCLVETALLRETRGLSHTGMHLVVHDSAPLVVRGIGSCP